MIKAVVAILVEVVVVGLDDLTPPIIPLGTDVMTPMYFPAFGINTDSR